MGEDKDRSKDQKRQIDGRVARRTDGRTAGSVGKFLPDEQAETDPVAGLVECVDNIPWGRHRGEMVEMKTAR